MTGSSKEGKGRNKIREGKNKERVRRNKIMTGRNKIMAVRNKEAKSNKAKVNSSKKTERECIGNKINRQSFVIVFLIQKPVFKKFVDFFIPHNPRNPINLSSYYLSNHF